MFSKNRTGHQSQTEIAEQQSDQEGEEVIKEQEEKRKQKNRELIREMKGIALAKNFVKRINYKKNRNSPSRRTEVNQEPEVIQETNNQLKVMSTKNKKSRKPTILVMDNIDDKDFDLNDEIKKKILMS